MAKNFYKRSILKSEKTKEEEKWENKREEENNTKNKKAPTTVFQGINKDDFSKASRNAIEHSILEEDEEEDREIGD